MGKGHGHELPANEGTGPGGRISKQDIEAVIAAGGVPAAAPPAYSAPVAAASSRPSTPPPAAPGVSGGQAHVAPETAVPREKIYFRTYEVHPMSTLRQPFAHPTLPSNP